MEELQGSDGSGSDLGDPTSDKYPTEMVELRAKVIEKALRLGFADCRICTADPPDELIVAAYEKWLANGMNGDMGFFERSRRGRLDLKHRFPWAKSVIVLRWDYPNARPGEVGGSGVGASAFREARHATGEGAVLPRIARYAAGRDYHDQLKDRLLELETYVRKWAPGGHAMWYQDTGPVLEHVYAQRAGIGWTGKHTLTLNKSDGSYFWLAEIVTSADLPVDAPATNHCGSCSACIDACPTAAIVEPYVLDATKCISYVTIEHKGPVAPGLRGELDGYVFGCDICQEVCPYVQGQLARQGTKVFADDWQVGTLESLTLMQVLMLRDPQLLEAVKGTPLERTGAARLKRNAALVAGTGQTEAALKGINHCITHPEAMVREACAWALGCFGGTASMAAARQMLVTHQKRESDDGIREVVIESLARLRAADPKPALPPAELSQAAVWALEKIAAEGQDGELDGNERPGEDKD
jgi:epoxyqueuosine reductase